MTVYVDQAVCYIPERFSNPVVFHGGKTYDVHSDGSK